MAAPVNTDWHSWLGAGSSRQGFYHAADSSDSALDPYQWRRSR
jgi:hypothetical protein